MSQPYVITGSVAARVEPYAILKTSAGMTSLVDGDRELPLQARVFITLMPPKEGYKGAEWTVSQEGRIAVLARGGTRHVLALPPDIVLLPKVVALVRTVKPVVRPRARLAGLDELAPDEFGVPEPGPGLDKLLPAGGTVFSNLTPNPSRR